MSTVMIKELVTALAAATRATRCAALATNCATGVMAVAAAAVFGRLLYLVWDWLFQVMR